MANMNQFACDNMPTGPMMDMNCCPTPMGSMATAPGMGCPSSPIVHPAAERVVNRCFVHEVPHL